MEVFSSFIHNCQHLEATKMTCSRWVDEYPVVHPDNGLLFSATKKWAIAPWKDTEETQMHITQWNEPICKRHCPCDPNYMTFWKRPLCGNSRKVSGCQGLREGRKAEGEHRGFLQQWHYAAGHVSFYICPNPEDVQEWTPNLNYGLAWPWGPMLVHQL